MERHKHGRHSIRLKGFDYSQSGGYYVTIGTHRKQHSFGAVVNGQMRLSPVGTIASQCWLEIPHHAPKIQLDQFVIMPNHVHGILFWLDDTNTRPRRGLINQTPTKWILMKNPNVTLGKIIRQYKAKTSKMIHDNGYPDFKWQRNYYEHVIRNEHDLNRIREYIHNNPMKWHLKEHPHN